MLLAVLVTVATSLGADPAFTALAPGSTLAAQEVENEVAGGAEAEAEAGVRRGRLSYPVTSAEAEVDVDGVLDEPLWRRARELGLVWEVSPGDNERSPVETVCRLGYDTENLYFACTAHDPDPEAIRAYVTDRDDVAGQDRIILTIDPFNDQRRAFEFGVSALGVQWDALFDPVGGRSGGDRPPSDPSWDAIWSSAGRITDEGYVVEAAIPFKSLRFPTGDGPGAWGFFVSRRWPRGDDVDLRSMRWDRSDQCLLCQANLLTGLGGVEPGGALQLTPTLTASRTDEREGAGAEALTAGPVEPEIGLTGRWRITSDLTLDGTVNPDFSQVEADAPQLSINNRFALRFPEKRPFFLEGTELFRTPVEAVFTRTVRDPSVGLKLTGKSGANAGGLLVARDEINAVVLPGPFGSTGVGIDGGVTDVFGRVRRDVGESSTVGALLTLREGTGYHNRVAGADAFLRVGSAGSLQLQYLRSETRYPDDLAGATGQPSGPFAGDAAALSWRHDTRAWGWSAEARVTTDGFRADAGFVNQVDLANGWISLRRSLWADRETWYTALHLNAGGWSERTLGTGDVVSEGTWLNARYQGPMQSSVWLNLDYARQGVEGVVFEHPRLWFGSNVTPIGNLTVGLSGNVGGGVDFANAREGLEMRLSPSAALRVGRRVDLRLTGTYQSLSHEGEPVFDALVTQLRTVYNFSSRAFVRAIVQLRRTDRNPALWEAEVAERSTSLSSQLLFSYKLNPLSVLFLGYSDSRSGGVDAEGASVPLEPRGRSFFLKLGYAWRP